ncbi:hypothetical protein AGOR_G00051640 [Albula goreensis]|uniref:BHLH domain-containing protein n=1 Tax=Albula goreensis TaxID=1534307 RepID=A0A8T3E1Y9_9TELE|nr:hypothetical protein AGOR_G00051640 [Albula goreensis]
MPQDMENLPIHVQRENSIDQWSSESEGESSLNEFQRKMKREHRQALSTVNKACIIVERNRRKRITVSCSKLRQLLPQFAGARSDMVTVLEMTVAFLEHVHQAVQGHFHREHLFPPDDLCRRWLSDTRQRRQLSQKQSSMEERPGQSIGERVKVRKRKSPVNENVHRGKQNNRELCPTSMQHSPIKFCTPTFWCSPALSSVTHSPLHPKPWNYCSTAEDEGQTNLSEDVPSGEHAWSVGSHALGI